MDVQSTGDTFLFALSQLLKHPGDVWFRVPTANDTTNIRLMVAESDRLYVSYYFKNFEICALNISYLMESKWAAVPTRGERVSRKAKCNAAFRDGPNFCRCTKLGNHKIHGGTADNGNLCTWVNHEFTGPEDQQTEDPAPPAVVGFLEALSDMVRDPKAVYRVTGGPIFTDSPAMFYDHTTNELMVKHDLTEPLTEKNSIGSLSKCTFTKVLPGPRLELRPCADGSRLVELDSKWIMTAGKDSIPHLSEICDMLRKEFDGA
jgi:hypothetical protein